MFDFGPKIAKDFLGQFLYHIQILGPLLPTTFHPSGGGRDHSGGDTAER